MRILTNRNFKRKKDWECIEKINNQFFWKGEEWKIKGFRKEGENIIIIYDCIGFGFPVDEEFVIEKFKECGREYKPN